MQDVVCTEVNASNECTKYTFTLETHLVMTDYDGRAVYYVPPTRTTFSDQDVEANLSFEGASWREDFQTVDVSASNAAGEPRPTYAEIHARIGDQRIELEDRSLELFALRDMPASGKVPLIPGYGDGYTFTAFKRLELGGNDDGGGGIEAQSQIFEQRSGPAPTSIDYDQNFDLLPFIFPAAMPDYADPGRPAFHLLHIGEGTSHVMFARVVGSYQGDGFGGTLVWTYVRDGADALDFQYPELPASMPWLGFADYMGNLDVVLANVSFDFTSDWPDARDTVGPALLHLFGQESPGGLPSEFRVQLSTCCGGGER